MSVLDNVDAATNLAKNNEVQLLVFRVNNNDFTAFYAINVFKTREDSAMKKNIRFCIILYPLICLYRYCTLRFT
jgi:chemotaxis signal transduction protein